MTAACRGCHRCPALQRSIRDGAGISQTERRIVINYPKEVPTTMWLKMAIGAVLGFIVGSFAAPGYTLWITVGVLAGYAVEALMRRRDAGDGSDQSRND